MRASSLDCIEIFNIGCGQNDRPAGISIAELATHSTNDDCWTAIHGNVYDLTLYANVHPGGAFFITRNCGIDGTADYDKFHLPALLGILRDGELQGPLASRRRRFLKGKKGKGIRKGKGKEQKRRAKAVARVLRGAPSSVCFVGF